MLFSLLAALQCASTSAGAEAFALSGRSLPACQSKKCIRFCPLSTFSHLAGQDLMQSASTWEVCMESASICFLPFMSVIYWRQHCLHTVLDYQGS